MRSRRPWLFFCLAVALGLGAMGWITRIALRTERAGMEARRRITMEEKVRLAIWRMDSTLALFLTPEGARPHFHYESFYPLDQAYARGGGKADPGQVLIPSPMLIGDDPLVRLRFQIAPDGALSSPLVPPPALRALAVEVCPDPARLEEAAKRLEEIRPLAHREDIRAAMIREGATLLGPEDIRRLMVEPRGPDRAARFVSPYTVHQGGWTAFWLKGDLMMARQVWIEDREYFQACWLDLDAVRELLMSSIRDILPQARLLPEPEGEAASGDRDRLLSAMPLRLDPGDPPASGEAPSPARAALWFGWVSALLGAIAGALALHRTLQLGQRRAEFASAVTHELRTPLTTFRLYTELLAKGMVAEEGERMDLLQGLVAESSRLDHLVKNVLAYARLEGGRGATRERVEAGRALIPLLGRLGEQASQAGMRLEPRLDAAFTAATLWTDPVVLEQILSNLVDNACKYAKGAADTTILVLGSLEGGRACLRVQDQGPGLGPRDRRALFIPFHRSTEAAARRAPGVGLGLALCRRLARDQGGDLELEPTAVGAGFRLWILLAP